MQGNREGIHPRERAEFCCIGDIRTVTLMDVKKSIVSPWRAGYTNTASRSDPAPVAVSTTL